MESISRARTSVGNLLCSLATGQETSVGLIGGWASPTDQAVGAPAFNFVIWGRAIQS